MNTSSLCTCLDCSGAGCACGCNGIVAVTPMACDCARACRCESAAGGCVCR